MILATVLVCILGGCGSVSSSEQADSGQQSQEELSVSEFPDTQEEAAPDQESENTSSAAEQAEDALENTAEPEETETEEPEAAISEESAAAEFQGVRVTFDYERAGTPASNQIAVWVEDAGGNLVKTVYVTNFTASGGYQFREDTLADWVQTADPFSMSEAELDAVSGATPDSGTAEFIWDGTDTAGESVPDGQYVIKTEGTLYWSSRVLFEAVVDTAASEGEIPVTVTYSEDDETNKTMIQNLNMSYISG